MNNFYRDNLKAAAFFTDLSSDFQAGAKDVYIPNVTEMTAHSKSNATAVTLNNPTDTKVTLVVDTWYETSFASKITTLLFNKLISFSYVR